MQKHIFRSSDIRGIVPSELSLQDSYQIAQACITWFAQKSSNLQRIAVAFDGRLHGQEIYQQVSQAIIDTGHQVYFLGVCPTPAFLYRLHQLPVQAGIMITASGSSSEFNGFKLYLNQNLVQGIDLLQIYELSLHQPLEKVEHPGKIIPCPIIEQYLTGLWQEFAHLSEYDFDIVIDCGNGVTGPVMKQLIHRMGWKKVQIILDHVDGTFPVHVPEPFESKNMQYLKSELKKNKKLFGIAFDGDGDRMLAMESNGHMVLGDRLLLLFAKDILEKQPHRAVVHDINNTALSEIICQNHGKSLCVNSNVINQSLEEHNAIFSAQMHGKLIFKDRHAGYSDGMYTMLRLLDLLVKNRKSLKEMLKLVDQQIQNIQFGTKLNVPDKTIEL